MTTRGKILIGLILIGLLYFGINKLIASNTLFKKADTQSAFFVLMLLTDQQPQYPPAQFAHPRLTSRRSRLQRPGTARLS